jgi:hypothetical protein
MTEIVALLAEVAVFMWLVLSLRMARRELHELRAAQDADRKVVDWLARSHNARLRGLEASRRGLEARHVPR